MIGRSMHRVCSRGFGSLRTARPLVLQVPVDETLDLYVAVDGDATIERPANGGLRLWNYESEDDAIEEAGRLATGMAYKHGMYNTGFSGGKLVCRARKPSSLKVAVSDKKEAILKAVSQALNSLGGTVFTGCDMNMGISDMEKLSETCPYVLASLGGDENLDANEATAWGVIGATHGAMMAVLGGVQGKTLLIHGVGQVGSTAARVLAEAGAHVKTFDKEVSRADIPGCENMSHLTTEQFITQECDVLLPCSIANLITEEIAPKLRCKLIASAANLPFETPAARKAAENRQIVFVPESICSAGAIILDSVEMYARTEYCEAEPRDIYQFIAELTMTKAVEFLSLLPEHGNDGKKAENAAAEDKTSEPVGVNFSSWRSDSHKSKLLKESNAGTFLAVTHARATATASARMFSTSTRPARSFSTSSAAPVYDTVIAGAGIMGLNIAYQLKRRDPNHRVLVLESQATLGQGSSGYSTGFLRAYYSFDHTMQFALDGIGAYKNWGEYCKFSTEETAASDTYFTETGALWMLGYTKAKNEEMQQRLASFGVESETLDEAEFVRRFPVMSPEPFPEFDEETGEVVEKDLGEFSAVYEHGAGHVDSMSALGDMLKVCEREGVEVRFRSKVAEFVKDGDAVTGARLADGSVVQGKNVVNCAGPWFQALNDTAGVKTSTQSLPTRIQVGHKHVPKEYWDLPFTADQWGASGIYFMPRSHNGQMVFGSVAHRFESEVVDPDDYNTALDPDVKQDYLNCLFHRLPGLSTSGEVIGFSSMYTVNQDDVHPVMGETKEAKGLWVCNGFSGHGFKLAPAVGSLMAQGITGTKIEGDDFETHIPLDFMGPNRAPLSLEVKTHFA